VTPQQIPGARKLGVLKAPQLDDRPRDVCGRRKSHAAMKGYRKGVKPANAGETFPADPPSDDEVVALMDACGTDMVGRRNRALIAVLRGSGLRISEALALIPRDVDFDQATVLVRCGKGSKRRRSGINRGTLDELAAWLQVREQRGLTDEQPIFAVVEGRTKGGRLGTPYVRVMLKKLAERTGVQARVAPHQLRHAHAVAMARRGVPVPIISRQLGHSNVATTATYLQGIADVEVFEIVAGLDWGQA
jgi:site-specific recombinase XerC